MSYAVVRPEGCLLRGETIQSWFLISSNPRLRPLPRSAILWVFCCIRYLWEPALPCLPACHFLLNSCTHLIPSAHITRERGVYFHACSIRSQKLTSCQMSWACVLRVCGWFNSMSLLSGTWDEFHHVARASYHITHSFTAVDNAARCSCLINNVLVLNRWTLAPSCWAHREVYNIFPSRLSGSCATDDHRSEQGDALVSDWFREGLTHSWVILVPCYI